MVVPYPRLFWAFACHLVAVVSAELSSVAVVANDGNSSALDELSVINWDESLVASLNRVHCTVSRDISVENLRRIAYFNCREKVPRAKEAFLEEVERSPISAELRQTWEQKASIATFLCDQSFGTTDDYAAAWLAVNAWGKGIMDDSECCNLVHAPYCEAAHKYLSMGALCGIAVAAIVAFAGTTAASCCMRSYKRPRRTPKAEPEMLFDLQEASETRMQTQNLEQELVESWMKNHSLRVLPSAQEFAETTASVFVDLFRRFDFQRDSVRNQHQHLLSLWRSHCATVADRSVQNRLPVEEDVLLSEACGDLHAELLEGFYLWRNKYRSSLVSQSLDEELVDATVAGEASTTAAGLKREIQESAAFLLVWGEAGNIRFMPEVLYFLTEVLLTSKSKSPQEVYGPSAVAACEHKGPYFVSSLFLSKVIRPIYNSIFDEWYDRVTVDPSDGRDVKVLKEGFERYLPPDVANYDDWNELFCDPHRLFHTIVLDDGTSFFDHPSEERSNFLYQIDWSGSLHRHETKTHREVHSMWGVFATTNRILLLHALLFFTGMMWQFTPTRAPTPTSQADSISVEGNSWLVRFSAIGLLVPWHGLLMSYARWELSSVSFLRWSRSRCQLLRSVFLTLLWLSPLATYIAIRRSEVPEAPEAEGSGVANPLLLLHAVLSICGCISHLMASSRVTDRRWKLTPVPWRQQVFRYFFWIGVLAIKFYMSLVIFGAIVQLAMSLDLPRLGEENLSEVSRIWFTNTWASKALEYLLIWGFCFFVFIADTGIWYQVGCTCLGVAFITTRRHQFALEHSIFKIPQRFSSKILPFSFGSSSSQNSSSLSKGGGAGAGNSSSGSSLSLPPATKTSSSSSATTARNNVSGYFPVMWDRIMEQMRCEDKCDDESWKVQSFNVLRSDAAQGDAPGTLTPSDLHSNQPSPARQLPSEMSSSDWGNGSEEGGVKVPGLFVPGQSLANLGKALSKGSNLRNVEMQWRLNSIGRCLAMSIPPPFRAPHIPGLTVLIPHLREDILSRREDLFSGHESGVPLIDWVRVRYRDEFDAFVARMREGGFWKTCPEDLGHWSEYSDEQWQAICMWASMRLQTLWRTVAGMSLYRAVLQCHYEAQADKKSKLAQAGIWNPSECFTCLVSMQLYRSFTATQLEHTNQMFETFPDTLKVAFLDYAEKNLTADSDSVHERLPRRYFSCLIDRSCPLGTAAGGLSARSPLVPRTGTAADVDAVGAKTLATVVTPSATGAQVEPRSASLPGQQPQESQHQPPQQRLRESKFRTAARADVANWRSENSDAALATLRRQPKYRIELPGFPILGDGKSDNQNHAIPFMRGAFCQCIDSNQGAYFEQMMLLPCVLGEFRTDRRGGNGAKKIIGLPEHITSDFGSVGDFAAGAELAFGTVLQRSHAVLGARMHYGHPDIMNKQYMIQQGGVSKATKTLNLSEDIFAGMDFMLRGCGRSIKHCEYFYLTKGRDLGFNAVMGFFSKISSGTGEQILTRQMFRLSQVLPLPESLSFHYAHAGYYMTQAFISLSMPITVSTWLLVLVAGCEDSFQAYMNCPTATAGESMAVVLSAWCSWVLLFFLFGQAMPLFMQMWMEMGLRAAFRRLATQWLTGSWCFFIFQAKLVGHYILNEIRYGGAAYVSTGRGLPTQRRPFIGVLDKTTGKLAQVGGLYLDYAALTYYDAIKLLLSTILVLWIEPMAGGVAWTFVAVTIISWLYAPFLFNPYQFSKLYFPQDLLSWWTFFFRESSSHWMRWYDHTQLRPKRGFRHAVWDIKFLLGFFILAVWVSAVHEKLALFRSIYSVDDITAPERGLLGSMASQAVVMLPPVVSALGFCLLAALVEGLLARCIGRRSSGKDSDNQGESEGGSTPAASSQGGWLAGCLPLCAVAVVGLEIAEAILPAWELHQHHWRRAFVGSLALKLLLLGLTLFLAEGMLKRSYLKLLGPIAQPLILFVHSNRFARDVLISAVILWTLAVGVVLNTLNEIICPKLNLHQLLIYRACPLPKPSKPEA